MARKNNIDRRIISAPQDGVIDIRLSNSDRKYYTLPADKSLVIDQQGNNLSIYLKDTVTGTKIPEAWFKSAYEIAVNQGFVGTETQWLLTLIGPPGITPTKGIDYVDGTNGKEVQIQASGTAIQWKYSVEDTWHDLVSLDTLIGKVGDTGRSIELQSNGSYIQWRYVGDISWLNLIAITSLKGNPGTDGYTPRKGIDYNDGTTGASIITVAFVGNDLIFTKDNAGTVTLTNAKITLKGINGDPGNAGYTPIKGVDYFDGTNGTTPVKGIDYFDGLKGDKGDKGDTGVKGDTGTAGAKGDTGSQGIQGIKGDTGNQGIQGIQGIQGVTGNTGDTGAYWTNFDGGDPADIMSIIESFDFGAI